MSENENNEWLITMLLCFFLGGFGVHSFYQRKTGIGIAQLCLTLFGCGAGWIWALVDFILILIGQYRRGDGTLLTR